MLLPHPSVGTVSQRAHRRALDVATAAHSTSDKRRRPGTSTGGAGGASGSSGGGASGSSGRSKHFGVGRPSGRQLLGRAPTLEPCRYREQPAHTAGPQQPPLPPPQQQQPQARQEEQQQPPPATQQRGQGMETLSRLFDHGPPSGRQGAQHRLVDRLKSSGLVKTPRVEEALRAVDRRLFIDAAHAAPADAYQDTPLRIGYSQTISAPHMHAICLELLERHLRPGCRALDVGSGSGYLAAAMALMVSPGGYVLGVEKVSELAARSVQSIREARPDLMGPEAAAFEAEGWRAARRGAGGRPPIDIVHGNILSADMLLEEDHFDVIHVGAAAEELHPLLLGLLAPGGRMVVPVGPRYAIQVLTVVDKSPDGRVISRPLMDVGYVPLTRPGEAG